MKRFIVAAIAIMALCVQAKSEMMIISIEELRDTAPHIVYATFLGPADGSDDSMNAFSYYLDVLEVYKGNLRVGRQKVLLGSGHATLKKGAKVIAFLTKRLEFSWYGAPLGLTENPAEDVWDFAGFYDYNGYLVSTHNLTLPMIKDFFVGYKPIHWHYKGHLHFFDAQSDAVVATKYAIDVRSAHMQLPAQFRTNLPLNDFAADTSKPDFRGGLYTVLESSVRHRSLGIDGKIVGVDVATGTFTCQFYISHPSIFTEAALLAYIAAPQVDQPWYELEVKSSDGATWRIDLDKRSSDSDGIADTPWGFLQFASFSSTPVSFVTGYGGTERVELRTDVVAENEKWLMQSGTVASIVQYLMKKPIDCMVYRGSAENPVLLGPATISLKRTHIANE